MTERFGEDAAGLLAALDAAGVETGDFGPFGHVPELGTPPPAFDSTRAAPILTEWLPRVRTPALKEAIARSLTAEVAVDGSAARAFVSEFREAPLTTEWDGARWAYANALSTIADADLADDLIELLRDRRYGTARQMLCEALRRTKDPRAPDALIEVIRDRDIGGHAIDALRRYGPKSSLPHLRRARTTLEDVLVDPTATDFTRRMARAALERIDRLS